MEVKDGLQDGLQDGLLVASGILCVVAGALVCAPTVSALCQKMMTKAFMAYSGARSRYRWTLRLKTPDFLRPVGDLVFKLNENASLDSPRNLVESIKVLSAILKKDNLCVDVADKINHELQSIPPYGTVLLLLDQLETTAEKPGSDECSLEVSYVGHANPEKRIPAAEFAVKYNGKVYSTIAFPPYKATEKIQRGFTTNKVLHARTFHEKNLTPLAKKYAGLKANFYDDVASPHVLKGHIDHKEVHVLLSENGKAPKTIVVKRK